MTQQDEFNVVIGDASTRHGNAINKINIDIEALSAQNQNQANKILDLEERLNNLNKQNDELSNVSLLRIAKNFDNAIAACYSTAWQILDALKNTKSTISDYACDFLKLDTQVQIFSILSSIGGIFTAVLGYYQYRHAMQRHEHANPIGISLIENKEIELVSYNKSAIMFNYNNDYSPLKTSWIGAADALLVYDHNDNQKVDSAKEVVLTKWCESAKTDFEALLCNFDTNKDKVFNKEDHEFNKFLLWQDKNQDGVSQDGELISLQEAGVIAIDFNAQEEIHGDPRELGALNKAETSWVDGKVTYAYDLVFTHDAVML